MENFWSILPAIFLHLMVPSSLPHNNFTILRNTTNNNSHPWQFKMASNKLEGDKVCDKYIIW